MELLNDSKEDFDLVRTTDFEVGTKYNIKNFEVVGTKFGRKIVAILNNGTYFLPPRYANAIKRWKNDVEDINCKGLIMVFEGRRNDDFNSPILKFEFEEN